MGGIPQNRPAKDRAFLNIWAASRYLLVYEPAPFSVTLHPQAGCAMQLVSSVKLELPPASGIVQFLQILRKDRPKAPFF